MEFNKVLIVCSEFPPQPGGMGNHAYNLANQLSSRNFELTVLTDYRTISKDEEDQFDALQNFQIKRIPRYKILMHTYLRRIRVFRNLIKLNKPDILIASGKFPLWMIAFGVKRKAMKKMVVIHGSEINLINSWQQKLNDLALKKVDQIIAVSNYTKSLVNHLDLENISVIKNGFEKEYFSKISNGPQLKGFPKLITVGNLSQRKGQHNVIHKIPRLLKDYPEVHYHMVGTPSEKEKLITLASTLNVEKYITIHGIVNQSELNHLLNKSDIFVMLSEQTAEGDIEGFGIAILEANYLGLPAIGSRNCGIEDAIKHEESGVLVNFKDNKAFVMAVRNILQHRKVFSENAQKWALGHAWNIVIEKYIKLIQNL